MRKRISVSITVLTIVTISVMLNSNLITAYASSTDYDEDKYYWLDAAIAARYPNATAKKLAEVKAQALRQLEINEKKIADTNGAILKNPPATTKSSSYMADYLYPECNNGGAVYNPTYLEGENDPYYTQFYTPNLNQTANVVGEMTSSTSHGDVYIVAKQGPTGDGEDGDVLILWGSNSSSVEGNW